MKEVMKEETRENFRRGKTKGKGKTRMKREKLKPGASSPGAKQFRPKQYGNGWTNQPKSLIEALARA
jgi:hypothetical protein